MTALAAQELARNRVFAAGADGDVFMASDSSDLRVRLRESRPRRSGATRGTIVVWQPS